MIKRKTLIVYSELINDKKVVSKEVIYKYFGSNVKDDYILHIGIKLKEIIKAKYRWEIEMLKYKLHIKITLSE